MSTVNPARRLALRAATATLVSLSLVTALAALAAPASAQASADPRIGLKAGLYDAGEAAWNLRLLSATPPSEKFVNGINSDLAFTGHDVIQGSFNGYQVWDISNPAKPVLKIGNYCPASQSDVSVYQNLLFVSSESTTGRIDCGGEGVKEPVSEARLRGIRIFDITDLAHPKNVANVQTCRGSHTHTVVVDPKDKANVYVYVSGSAGVRPAAELAGCVSATPDKDQNSALFRIEVIKVPLAHPEQAAIVTSPRIFNDLTAPARHGETPEDIAAAAKAAAEARAKGMFTAMVFGVETPIPGRLTQPWLDSIVTARNGTGPATAADSAALRAALPAMIAKLTGETPGDANKPKPGPTQCHDITVYPAIGLAGGACEGYGLLLDIKDPTHPVRLDAAADSNFSYWHSATFSNDGTKVLFSDEWGGGSAPKCRATDPHQWGADALFTIANGHMTFQGYYKMPAAQTSFENCVAHNGSLIPIPGRDIMVQAWYQGGVSVFDWSDPAHAKEIAFFDRGPIDSTRLVLGGSWSAYWYNGVIVSSEIVRGLDLFELTPSPFLSQNEIDAAKTVHLAYLNVQDQPKFTWPPSFALSRAYLDQLERDHGQSAEKIASARKGLDAAAKLSGAARAAALSKLAAELHGDAAGAGDASRAHKLAYSVGDLAKATK